jgi:hypothetical protein
MDDERKPPTKFQSKLMEDPWVPIGCAVTLFVLLGGLRAFMNKQSRQSQYFMRARVAAQGGTVLAIGGAAAYRAYTRENDTSNYDPAYQGNLGSLPPIKKLPHGGAIPSATE